MVVICNKPYPNKVNMTNILNNIRFHLVIFKNMQYKVLYGDNML